MSSEPRFITIEGGEGAGKSTLIQNLKDRIEKMGVTVCLTREPGGTPLAEDIRNLLLSPQTSQDPMAVETEALLVSAARRDHVDHLIRPELDKGHAVICDRFIDSTRAYQGRSLSNQQLAELEAFATNGLLPGTTFLLDADPAKLLERRKIRGGASDRFEKQDINFHIMIREAFLACAERFSDRIVVLNALLPPEELAENAMAVLIERIGFTSNV